MKNIITCLMVITSSILTAQITGIPDASFEQWLINASIDSDGIVNGQILTSDAEEVTEIYIDGSLAFPNITDFTGLEDFASLERLEIFFTDITELDVTHNLQLKELRCGSNFISEIDLSANSLLEIIDISTGGDVGPWNVIQKLDLSSNPNIHMVKASDCTDLEVINLRNGANNENMEINLNIFPGPGPDIDPTEIYNNVCIEIDNGESAQNNQLPYSEWEISHHHVSYQLLEDCTLGNKEIKNYGLMLYPNPASNIVTVSNITPIKEITIFDSIGRTVLQKKCNENNTITLDISSLQAGNYIVKVGTAEGSATEKLITI